MPDIFLSYAREDLERAKTLAQALESLGWTVFWDRKIPPGKTWREVIGAALDDSRCVVVAWSEHSVASAWVHDEADEGKRRNILVPVLFDDIRPPLGFRQTQAANLAAWQGDTIAAEFLELAEGVAGILGSPLRHPIPPPSKAISVTPKLSAGVVKTLAAFGNRVAKLKRFLPWKSAVALVVSGGLAWGVWQLGRKPIVMFQTQSPTGSTPEVSEKADTTIDRIIAAQPPGRESSPKLINKQPATLSPSKLPQARVPIVYDAPIPVQDTQIKAKDRPLNAPLPFTSFRDTLKDGTPGPEMVRLPPGSFTMGDADSPGADEKPAHAVRIEHGFAIGKYEVTFAEYDRFAQATGWPLPGDQGWGRGSRPVIGVSWADAVAYTQWLSEQTGKRYRLPSEAEWEYAARAGTTTQYWWGNTVGNNNANCGECGSQWDSKQTAPVGSFSANPFGLYDTAGNVREWVQDCYHDSYAGAPATGTPAWEAGCQDGGRRVIRGGSWSYGPAFVRAANRGGFNPDFRLLNLGFRLAQDF